MAPWLWIVSNLRRTIETFLSVCTAQDAIRLVKLASRPRRLTNSDVKLRIRRDPERAEGLIQFRG
jgi:hypothetical protein